MDITPDESLAPVSFSGTEEPAQVLSYDEDVPYESQVEPEGLGGSSLAGRIGKGKVYLLADAERTGKRKAQEDTEEDVDMMEEDASDLDPDARPNALLFTGSPIAHLPTQRIFAYATHFEAHPLGLEWVSDTTCVLVFSSRGSARKAYRLLQKSSDEKPSLEFGSESYGCVSARAIPVPLWPAEKQLSRTLEQALGKTKSAEQRESERMKQEAGLAGPLKMRWARKDDVKKRGARRESEFYKKHGELAGKEVVNGRDIPNLPGSGSGSRKRGREDRDEYDEAETRAKLDRELDAFLEEGSDTEHDATIKDGTEEVPASPPSKMRSDYIADVGRKRGTNIGLGWGESRKGVRQSRHGLGRGGSSLLDRIGAVTDVRENKRHRRDGSRTRDSPPSGNSRRGGKGNPRPKKSQQELDDELEAFLNGGS